MSDTERTVVELITSILSSRRPGTVVTGGSAMGSPTEWDSLAFVEIFTTVTEHFGLAVSDDDAIHFMSVAEITDFVDSHR